MSINIRGNPLHARLCGLHGGEHEDSEAGELLLGKGGALQMSAEESVNGYSDAISYFRPRQGQISLRK